MQASDRDEFRRSFAAATIHDMFNWLTVFVLLPLEVAFGYLEKTTSLVVNSIHWQSDSIKKQEFLQKFTKPFTNMIIEVCYLFFDYKINEACD